MKKYTIIFIVLVGLCLRIGASLHWGMHQEFGDEDQYAAMAQNIVDGNGPRANDQVFAFRMPGYPYFLAFVKSIFPSKEIYPKLLRIIQSILSAGLIFLIFIIGRELLSDLAAYFLALAYALNPLHVIFPGLLLTESLYTGILFLSFYFLYLFFQDKKPKQFYLGVLFMVLSLYIKESSFFLPLFMLVLSFVFASLKDFRKDLLLLTVLTFISLLPWAYRNSVHTGEWIFLTTNGGRGIYDSVNPRADGGTDISQFVKEEEGWKGLSEVKQDKYWKKKSKEAIKENPIRLIKLIPAKQKRFWNLWPNFSDYKGSWIKTLFACYYLPIFLLALIGVLNRESIAKIKLFIFLVPILYFSLLHSFMVGSLRYRAPIEPFILLFAAIGFHEWWYGRKRN